MGLKCGIVGLPNVGKSTIFNALTSAGAQASNYPFCTIDPNVGVVTVPDERLDRLNEMYKPKKLTPTTVEFVDIAGLVKGASEGEGLGNKFLGHIREVDAILHIIRCFENPDIVHVCGDVDPKRDIEIINAELTLADLDTVEKKISRSEKTAKAGDKKAVSETLFLKRIREMLQRGEPIRGLAYTDDEKIILKECHLLTDKPVLYVANISDEYIGKGNKWVDQVRETGDKENAPVVVICGEAEAEIAKMDKKERAEYLNVLGVSEPGLNSLIMVAYRLLKLITFFTVGEDEVKAWTVTSDTKAPQAAGRIHSDIERGFIRAEIMAYDDLIPLGSHQAVKDKGLLRFEGRDYIVKDGDIINFRFAV
ncbi:MAG: redox-regulated ATPase YchF [Nitrospirae bacterium]|nr:redox-regulated ATPase YchF [Nitrospirota bacterium]